jgi:hypothetical protein
MSDPPNDSLYDELVILCFDHGPLVMDLCKCRQCGAYEFYIVPQHRGFEGGFCAECDEPGLDQVEVDP